MKITPEKDLYNEDGVRMFIAGDFYETASTQLNSFTCTFNIQNHVHGLGEWYHFFKVVEDNKQSEYKWWKPKPNTTYWYIDEQLTVRRCDGSDSIQLDIMHGNFNCFETKEKAKKERDIRSLWVELREFAKQKNSTHEHLVGHACTVKGIIFFNGPDAELAEKYFGDRLKLLDDL